MSVDLTKYSPTEVKLFCYWKYKYVLKVIILGLIQK